MEKNITFVKRVNFTKFGLVEKTVDEIIEIIRSGNLKLHDSEYGEYNLKAITYAIRNEPDPKIQNELKARFLPAVTFNGIWDGSRICRYSNVTALDFDYIADDEHLSRTSAKLMNTPFVLAVFRTFKPRRIKALIMHDNTDPNLHKDLYGQLIEAFAGYGIDESGKDLSRKTYLPWDDTIWVNRNCVPYHFVPAPAKTVPSHIKPIGKAKSPQSIINILNSSWERNHPEYWQRGNRASSVFKCACQFCTYGVPQDMAEDYFVNGGWIADDFTEDEILKHVRGAYSCNKSLYGSKDFI